MLEQLLETGTRRRGSAWGGTTSVIVHVAIILLVVYATAQSEPRRQIIRDGPIITRLAPPLADTPDGKTGADGGRTLSTASSSTTPPPLTPGPVDISIPSLRPDGISSTDSTLIADILGGRGGGAETSAGNALATGATVDTPVRVLAERSPAYPEILRAAGIGGTVTAQFVVDTTGRVEMASIRLLTSSHELFARAVTASLRDARFTPGFLGGRRVRTLVERSFRFDIAPVR